MRSICIQLKAAIVICSAIVVTSCANNNSEKQVAEMRTTTLKSADSLEIKTDVYDIGDSKAPVILLFHQAGYSRGEYREIAPKLNALGFSCISIDQRSGKGVKGVDNETFAMAKNQKRGTYYTDAMPDLEAALKYVQSEFKNQKLIIWGSSYSAALSFVLGSRNYKNVIAILAFAPGEYFEFEGRKISEYAAEVQVPVFITSALIEHENWKDIFDSLPNPNKQYYLPDSAGHHGSKALWAENQGHEQYWNAVKMFLKDVK